MKEAALTTRPFLYTNQICGMDIPVADLQKHLDGLAKTFEQPLPDALQKCAVEIRQAYGQNFDSAGYSGGAWPPRKDSLPHPLLILSGKLKAAATQEGADGNVIENDGRELGVGVEKTSSLPYPLVQHYGWAQKNIPPRPFIDVGDATISKCEQHVAADLAGKLQI